MSRYDPAHQDLHCLLIGMYRAAWVEIIKWLKYNLSGGLTDTIHRSILTVVFSWLMHTCKQTGTCEVHRLWPPTVSHKVTAVSVSRPWHPC